MDLDDAQREFLEGVRSISEIADYVLVADLKDQSLLKVSSIQSAALLRDKLGVRAVPVIVARDANRSSVVTSVMTAFSLGLDNLFLVWGDRFVGSGRPKNVYDFASLADLIAESRALAHRVGVDVTIFAPLDIASGEEGLERGRRRLRAGADLLLAQPPTTDAASTFRKHRDAIEEGGMADHVLIGAFPFRGYEDVKDCANKFGWHLPPRILKIAAEGERSLSSETRKVISLAETQGIRGVYLPTRGNPATALAMFGSRGPV